MKIQNKLFLILFGFSALLIISLVFLIQWSLDKGMIEYVNSKEISALSPITLELAKEYQEEGSWKNMIGKHRKFRRLISEQLVDSDFSPLLLKNPPIRQDFRGEEFRPKPRHKAKSEHQLRPIVGERRPPPPNEAHYALLDIDNNVVVGRSLNELEYSKIDITVNDTVVGYFAVSKRNQITKGYEVDFIEQQHSYLWAIALIAMCLVALVTLPLSRHLVEPIKLITLGMHKLTQGDYQQTIAVSRHDELGKLSRDYNELAFTLAENETARKRWLANISHELRTPVAILRGELEAMIDGVRPLTKVNVSSAHDEVKHLQRLIDDLSLLTSTDIGAMTYRKQHENLVILLAGEADKYKSYLANAGIEFSLSINIKSIDVYVDKTRLYQLFENIINNSIKYSAATKMTMSLSMEKNDKGKLVKLRFTDNGVGVSAEHLPYLFEHLYRVDCSRNRQAGGSGLGLSICQQIVWAHQGNISAEQADSGGLAIIIKLPLNGESLLVV
jgi:two-component system sensor histidine kinase BaeS